MFRSVENVSFLQRAGRHMLSYTSHHDSLSLLTTASFWAEQVLLDCKDQTRRHNAQDMSTGYVSLTPNSPLCHWWLRIKPKAIWMKLALVLMRSSHHSHALMGFFVRDWRVCSRFFSPCSFNSLIVHTLIAHCFSWPRVITQIATPAIMGGIELP